MIDASSRASRAEGIFLDAAAPPSLQPRGIGRRLVEAGRDVFHAGGRRVMQLTYNARNRL
jgi:hypothetical protein